MRDKIRNYIQGMFRKYGTNPYNYKVNLTGVKDAIRQSKKESGTITEDSVQDKKSVQKVTQIGNKRINSR